MSLKVPCKLTKLGRLVFWQSIFKYPLCLFLCLAYFRARQKVNVTIGRRFSQKVNWPPMTLRIGLLRISALQNDVQDVPVILQCRTPQETNPKGHWGPKYLLIKWLFLCPPCIVFQFGAGRTDRPGRDGPAGRVGRVGPGRAGRLCCQW